MAFAVLPNTKIELRIYSWFQTGSQIGINTLRININAITGAASVDSDDLCDKFSLWIAPFMKNVLAENTEFRGVSMQDFPTRVYTPEWSTEGIGTGAFVGETMPTQVSGIVTLKTAYAGGHGRGRLYIPFPAESGNDEFGRPNANYLLPLGQLADALVGPSSFFMTPATVYFSPIVSDPRGTGTLKVVTAAIGEAKWATQKRRGSFGQKNSLPAPLQ